MVTQGLRKQAASFAPWGDTMSLLFPSSPNSKCPVRDLVCSLLPQEWGAAPLSYMHILNLYRGVDFSAYNAILPSHPEAIKAIQQYIRSFLKQVVPRCSVF